MSQHEILTPTPLLKEDGSLTEAGFCKRNLYIYNRNAITAPKWRIKEWDFYQIGNRNFMAQICFANIGLGTAATASLLDLKSGKTISEMALVLGTTNRFIPPLNGDEPHNFEFKRGNTSLTIDVLDNKRHVTFFKSGKKQNFSMDFEMDMLPSHESITIATPFKKSNRFFYTNKTNCMPTAGKVVVGDKVWEFEKTDTFAVLDWGRGVWPHKNCWYWGNGSAYVDGKLFGFEITWGFGDQSAATETAVFYDGKCHKIGAVDVKPAPIGNWLSDWHFASDDGRFNLTMTPFYDNATGVKILGLVGAKCHQVHGIWNGDVTLDDGTKLKITDMYAFCEYMENLW